MILADDVEKLLSEAKEVEAVRLQDGIWYASTISGEGKTHRAKLLLIEPLKKDTAEDLLRELIELWDSDGDFIGEKLIYRAKKLLGEK